MWAITGCTNLIAPYLMSELEEKIKRAFDQCFTKDVDSSGASPIEKVLKIRGYSKATTDRKLVVIEWKLKYTENELAEAVMKAVSYSSC
ncbi:hypothetical protein [Paenibacillus sp. BC26]|uniref:hypothetical protein n=1 Tax=Paenibacillus sp. BC26 TaxID=1881032 RepID=UPI0011602AC5|nr:hypothetical protein [Paenibacillus sp. BC26]